MICAAIVCLAILEPWTDMVVSRGDVVAWMAHLTLVGNIQYFLTGFLLADFFLLLPTTKYRDWRWDIATAIGWPCFGVLLVASPGSVAVALPAIILLLYVAAFYGPLSSSAFASLWVASIGGMCYSIYLLHNYAIAMIGFVTERIGQRLPFGMRFFIQTILITPIVLAVCMVFYRLIEQPCMYADWPRRLRNQSTRGMQQLMRLAASKRT